MRRAPRPRANSEEFAGPRSGAATVRVLALVVILLFSFGALFILLAGGGASAGGTNEAADEPRVDSPETILFKPAQKFSRFSHSSPGQHAGFLLRFSCSKCHDRNGIYPKFPEHKDCDTCHRNEMNTADHPICLICHNAADLGKQNPPAKSFSNSLGGFNTQFDHAQHMPVLAAENPQQRCTLCHAPARGGVAQTIPANINAHQTCFGCHTPGRQAYGLDISVCGACHLPKAYAPTPATGRSFGIGFSHADHGPRRGLNCESCHTVLGRRLAQGKQVSSTFPAQHFPNTRAQTCGTCHNDQRTFGEANFINCKRCHTGSSFRL
ncbi:MAG TPA: cytochrome c3 family protein [Pyrinomonadaceae bacterium]